MLSRQLALLHRRLPVTRVLHAVCTDRVRSAPRLPILSTFASRTLTTATSAPLADLTAQPLVRQRSEDDLRTELEIQDGIKHKQAHTAYPIPPMQPLLQSHKAEAIKLVQNWRAALEAEDAVRIAEVVRVAGFGELLVLVPPTLIGETLSWMIRQAATTDADPTWQAASTDFLDMVWYHKLALDSWDRYIEWVEHDWHAHRDGQRVAILYGRANFWLRNNQNDQHSRMVNAVAAVLREAERVTRQADEQLKELRRQRAAANAANDTEQLQQLDQQMDKKEAEQSTLYRPSRQVSVVRALAANALMPHVAMTADAWDSLLHWTAFRWPQVAWRLYKKAIAAGEYVAEPEILNVLLSGSTISSNDAPLQMAYVDELRKIGHLPNRRSAHTLIHTLLSPRYARDRGDRGQSSERHVRQEETNLRDEHAELHKSPVLLKELMDVLGRDSSVMLDVESRDADLPPIPTPINARISLALKLAGDFFNAGALMHASAHRIILEQMRGNSEMHKAEWLYRNCRELDRDGRQTLIYAAMIQMYLHKNRPYDAKRVFDDMIQDTLRALPDGTVVGPNGERTLARRNDGNQLELHNDRIDDGYALPKSSQPPPAGGRFDDSGREVVCTLWPHAQAGAKLVDAFGARDAFADAERIYLRLLEIGAVQEDLASAMMRCYVLHGRAADALKVYEAAIQYNAVPTRAMVAAYVQALTKANRFTEAEERVLKYNRTLVKGFDPIRSHDHPAPVFHALALGYAHRGDVENVERIYRMMRTQLGPRRLAEINWNASFLAAARANSVEALNLAAIMLHNDRYRIKHRDYAVAIDLLGRMQKHSLALEWYQRAEKELHIIDTSILSALLRSYATADRGEEGLSHWRKMRITHSVYADHALLSTLLDVAGHHSTQEQVNFIWTQVVYRDHLRPNANNFASLAEAYMHVGAYPQAVNVLLDDMPRHKHRPAYRLLPGLIHGCQESGRIDLVVKLKEFQDRHYHEQGKKPPRDAKEEKVVEEEVQSATTTVPASDLD